MNVHADPSIAAILNRRSKTGAPLGECGNCREEHGHPKNCVAPTACIHGYAYRRQHAWGEENPDWVKGREAGRGVER